MRRIVVRDAVWRLSLAALAALGTMQAHAGDTGMSNVPEPVVLQGDGPWQRFIVKYRAGSAPRETAGEAMAERLLATAAQAGLADGVALRRERRLGVGADLLVADRPLDRDDARRLLAAFAADPEVEYAEPDAMMQHMRAAPAVPGPVPGD